MAGGQGGERAPGMGTWLGGQGGERAPGMGTQDRAWLGGQGGEPFSGALPPRRRRGSRGNRGTRT